VSSQSSLAVRCGVYALAALVIVLIPTSLWSEFISPLSRWNDWNNLNLSRGEQPDRTNGIPRVVQLELMVFRAIVAPPTVLAQTLSGIHTAYGDMARDVPYGQRTEPPAISALEWLMLGLPFWFTAVTGLSESLLLLRRRYASPS
jgi:hypothetical protein